VHVPDHGPPPCSWRTPIDDIAASWGCALAGLWPTRPWLLATGASGRGSRIGQRGGRAGMTDIDRAADIDVSRGFAQVTVRIALTGHVSQEWLSQYRGLLRSGWFTQGTLWATPGSPGRQRSARRAERTSPCRPGGSGVGLCLPGRGDDPRSDTPSPREGRVRDSAPAKGRRLYIRESAASLDPWPLPAAKPSRQSSTDAAVPPWLRTASSSRTTRGAGRLVIVPAIAWCSWPHGLVAVRGRCCVPLQYPLAVAPRL
jgi:hypothetical protein